MFRLASTVVVAVSAIFLLTLSVEAAPRRNATYLTVKKCYINKYENRVCRFVKKKKTQTKKRTKPITHVASDNSNSSTSVAIHKEASRFIGLHERRNRLAVQSITRINPSKIAWCAAFVNGILARRGYRETGSNLAMSFARYGAVTRSPQKGDIVVFRGHVGFFEGHVTRGKRAYVAVLGGNQSNSVRVSYFSAARVVSYRRAI